ncbi:MAG: Holliday junction branch migration DNA helicase RuvB [candidate division Zixibacteria bacterium]|nr:Holliday junction branch migration DNA helicase RuvB [candidate division Zixibacteria bacterium]
MSRERMVTSKPFTSEDEEFSWSLRPKNLSEYIGQKKLVEKLSLSIRAAIGRSEPIEHTLFYGPPGLGKTTLAHIIAEEMSSELISTTGPTLNKPGDLMGILTNLKRGDVLFIDEIHRMNKTVEEFLYQAIEDFQIDFLLDSGPHSKMVKFKLEQFTLVGATTRAGLLSAPLRDRFGIFHHLDFYPEEELSDIVKRSANLLNITIDSEGAFEIAKRSRGTPRIANRLLRRVRDYCQVKLNGKTNKEAAILALDTEGIDIAGLDDLDRKYLQIIINNYTGGPVGIEALSATINEETDTLQDMVEPYLLKIGFLQRTRKGRMVSNQGYNHLGKQLPPNRQQDLF